MGSLDEAGQRRLEKSKVIKIAMPRSNPNIKTDIDTELDNGWHIAGCTSYVDGSSVTQILYTFTKPKKNA